MAATKEAILERLSAVKSPEGTPLPATGTLSDVVVSDGKVFFSISVDAAVVQRWEGVRKQAEEAVRGLPGVSSAMVALTVGPGLQQITFRYRGYADYPWLFGLALLTILAFWLVPWARRRSRTGT